MSKMTPSFPMQQEGLHGLLSNLLKGGYIGDYIGDIKGDTRSLDYSSHGLRPSGLG